MLKHLCQTRGLSDDTTVTLTSRVSFRVDMIRDNNADRRGAYMYRELSVLKVNKIVITEEKRYVSQVLLNSYIIRLHSS